jgi:hypothetical protein
MAIDIKVFLLIAGIYMGFDRTLLLVYNSNKNHIGRAIIYEEHIIMETKSKYRIKYRIGFNEIEILFNDYKQMFYLDPSNQIIIRKSHDENLNKTIIDTISYFYSNDTLKLKSSIDDTQYSILNKNQGIVQYYNFSYYNLDKFYSNHIYLYEGKLIENYFDSNSTQLYKVENPYFTETYKIPIYVNQVYELNRRKNKIHKYIYSNYRIIGNRK